MRKYTFVVITMLWSMTSISNAGWFDSGEQQERDRREHAEQQFYQEQQKDNGLGVVVVALAVLSVAGLGVGAAVGSKARRDAQE